MYLTEKELLKFINHLGKYSETKVTNLKWELERDNSDLGEVTLKVLKQYAMILGELELSLSSGKPFRYAH